MSTTISTPVWNADKFHVELLHCLDEAFKQLSVDPNFTTDWIKRKTAPGTKTTVRQAVMLGKGGSGRPCGGFWMLAERYIKAEQAKGITSPLPLSDRWCFERYGDFVFYNAGAWEAGQKRTVMRAEVESTPTKLLGHFSGLVEARCPYKYLFIDGAPGMLQQVTAYSADSANEAVDWAGTTYWLIKIPRTPITPSTWVTFRADVVRHGGTIDFRKL